MSNIFLHSPEVKKEAWHYMLTGGIVHDPFWHRLTERRGMDPARFDRNHPNLAGYFSPPAVLGNQPHGPILDDLRHRIEINPERFAHWHPFWARVLSVETTPPPIVPPVVPPSVPGVILPPSVPGGPAAVPEPASAAMALVAIALIIACIAIKEGSE